MSKDLKEYFNKMPRSGALATAGRDGMVNIAYFGSAQMIHAQPYSWATARIGRLPHAVTG